MANLKEVRTRISSIKSTQQITAAMKMVAASKLRRAQNAIVKLRPYAVKLQEILGDLSSAMGESNQSPYARAREVERVLVIAIASNRGLCGGFNANVIRTTTRLIHQEYGHLYQEGKLSLITIGRKASEHFLKRNYPVVQRLDDIFDKLTFEQVVPVAEMIMAAYSHQEYDKIVLVYNQFRNAASQRVITEQYLPVMPPARAKHSQQSEKDYILEPPREVLAQELFPKILRIQLFKALLDSYASEHGARMTAMHQATDNAKEMLRELQLSYNKARQAAITNEILEIVSGANALQEG